MIYRLNKEDLLDTLTTWNRFLKRRVHLIACGGTALTLAEIKDSTKDADFIIPIEAEYVYLGKILENLGYQQVAASKWRGKGELYEYDFFKGKKIHTTELLESPLDKGNHEALFEFSYLYIGILNYYDLMISKLFRGTSVDIEDCALLIKAKIDSINMDIFKKRYEETAKYEIAHDRVMRNFESFLTMLKKEKLYG